MTIKANNLNLESSKECMIKILKSPLNWGLVILTYMIWSLVGMSYSTNQNFDMITTQQNYIMLLSLVSILSALFNPNTKLVKLALIGSISLLISFITVVVSKVGIFWLGYGVGYYILCPITLFLFLMQIKHISCFARGKYYEAFKECSITASKISELNNKKLHVDKEK